MEKTRLALLIGGLLTSYHLMAAADSRIIYGTNNNPLFQLNFIPANDIVYNGSNSNPNKPRDLSADEKNKVIAASQYWANVLSLNKPPSPVVININANNVYNAFAGSGLVSPIGNERVLGTAVAAQLQGSRVRLAAGESHGLIIIGNMGFYNGYDIPGSLSKSSQIQLTAVVAHEIGHALGIMTSASYLPGTSKTAFDNYISTWTSHLYDDNGKQAKPGMQIIYSNTSSAQEIKNGFDVRKNKPYFSGTNVTQVLNGSMRGVPVELEMNGSRPSNDFMSHVELKNSLMSHQSYRNYTLFMEAELAILQDIGYQIDRKNMFGRSVYDNNSKINNNQGYFLRNPQGTAYINGKTNTALQGIGLHVYGSGNTITQQADLLAGGIGATGIRIDGQANNLTINKNINIQANGNYGTGLLVAYGKNHNISLNGNIQALGSNGIAARFDFGNNSLGNNFEYRGSYIQSRNGNKLNLTSLAEELKGSLVTNFNVNGDLKGALAAIYISPNALVDKINIASGVNIQGDIISQYNEVDATGKPRLTQINLGTSGSSATYQLSYSGNIQGNNLVLNANQGKTALAGKHTLHSLQVAKGATLSGDNTIITNTLINNGAITLAKANNSITVKNSYSHGANSQLQLAFKSNQISKLIIQGSADIDDHAGITLTAERAFFPHNWTLNLDQLITFDSTSPAMLANGSNPYSINADNIAIEHQSGLVSLQVVADNVTNNHQIVANRVDNAYSQFAASPNNQQIAAALDGIALSGQFSDDLHELYLSLEDLAADPVVLNQSINQLSPVGYAAMFQATFEREQQLNHTVRQNIADKLDNGQWQGFATLLGNKSRQNSQTDHVGFDNRYSGIMIGATHASTTIDGLSYGIHSALTHQKVKTRNLQGAKGDSNNFSLGLHSYYIPARCPNFYLTALTRIGYEDNEFTSYVNIPGYQNHYLAQWHGYHAAIGTEIGYKLALSDNLSVTPFIGLDYDYIRHRPFTEKGNDSSRLAVDRQHADALYSNLGLKSKLYHPLSNGHRLIIDGQLYWQHQWLDEKLTQNAHFVGYNNQSFRQTSYLADKEGLGIKASFNYQFSRNSQIGLQLETTLFQSGYHNLAGNLFYRYQF